MQQQRRAEGREVIPIVKEASSLDAIRVSVVNLSYCVVETWCLIVWWRRGVLTEGKTEGKAASYIQNCSP